MELKNILEVDNLFKNHNINSFTMSKTTIIVNDKKKEFQYSISEDLHDKIIESNDFGRYFENDNFIVWKRMFDSVFDGEFDEEEKVIKVISGLEDEDTFFWLYAWKIDKSKPEYEGFSYIEDLSISMDDVGGHACLEYFIYKYFNKNNEYNKKRDLKTLKEKFDFLDFDDGFLPIFTDNFFTIEEFENMVNEIEDFYNTIKDNKVNKENLNLINQKFVGNADDVFYNGLYSYELIVDFYKNFLNLANNILKHKDKIDVFSFVEP